MATRLPFHEQLRYEREIRGWSQADLAEKVGCDTKTIGRWERGDGLPRPYLRQKLSDILGKNAEELGLVKEKTGDIKPVSSPDHEHNIAEASLFPTPTIAPSLSPMPHEVNASDHLAPLL